MRTTSHKRLRARDQYTSSTRIGGKGGAGPSSLSTTLEGPTEYISECKMDVKSTWHRMDHVSWSLGLFFQKPPWREVGLTQNPETMALQTLTTIGLFYFYHVWGPAWIEIHWNSIWLRAQSHMTSHYTWGSVTTLHDFGGVLGRPLDTFIWALTISWSRLLARAWSDPQPLSLCIT